MAQALTPTGRRDQAYVNHAAIAVDGSGSMHRLVDAVIRVIDAQVAGLAETSQKMDQETRATVYTFSGPDEIECVYYDKDVLRLPSLRGRYRATNATALIDATLLAMDDLALIPEKYGDHSFLLYVVTDGYENASRRGRETLRHRLASLPDNWTVAALVPNHEGRQMAESLGFAPGNVLIWDATSAKGLEEAGRRMAAATTAQMAARVTGRRSTKTLFQIDDSQLTVAAARAANLKQLGQHEYVIIPVTHKQTIKEFVESATTNYRVGLGYYQLNNSPTPSGKRGIIIQGNKDILVMENATKKVFGGREARELVGLPDHDVTVDPQNMGKDYLVFVQSTSVNRNLYGSTSFLLKTGA